MTDHNACRRTDCSVHTLETLLDVATDILFEFDADLRHTFVSASIEQVAGRPRSDFIGRTNRELGMSPALCDVWDEAVRGVFDTGKRRTLSFVFPAPDGSRHFETTLSPQRDGAGRVVAVAGVARDITESAGASEALARSEERLRLALVAANAGVWSWNIATGEISWSPENYALYGLDPGKGPASYEAWAKCVHPDDLPLVEAAVRAAVDGSAPQYRCEFRVLHPELGPRWLVGLGEVRFDDGKPVSMSGINLDIHARKQATLALAESDRAKDEFIATLAHELRNFVAPIQYRLDLLSRIPLSPGSLAHGIDVMRRHVEHMTRLIDDLLDLERVRSGRLQVRKESVDLRSVLEFCAEAARSSVTAKSQRLRLGETPQGAVVLGDANRLAQVFSNLLANASKFTGEGGSIDIEVTAGTEEVEVHVVDDGLGIPPESLESIFEVFAQESPTGTRVGGLGIGLALARRIVDLHDGAISAHSAGIGHGARFIVKLPRNVVAEAV